MCVSRATCVCAQLVDHYPYAAITAKEVLVNPVLPPSS